MHLCEHLQPYLFQSLPWKTGSQFDQSPIIAIAQTFMEEQRMKTSGTKRSVEIKRRGWKQVLLDIKEGEKMTKDG